MKVIVILDNIRSTQNVGSVFRTSDAVGIEKIYLAGITPAPIDRFGLENKRLTKVSLGAEKSVKWTKVDATRKVLDDIKQEGYTAIAIEQDKNSISLFDFNKKIKYKKIALVLGPEVDGLTQETLQVCDYILEIPMLGKKESLNVSVAFGIAVYQIMREQF